MRRKRVNPFEESQLWVKTDPPGFEIDVFENKGRGVRSTIPRQRGDFLLVYSGQIISKKEGERRERKKSSGYRYFYRDLCIDATKDDGRLCRLINHGTKKEINCKMKLCGDCLCLFATRDIQQGEELLYDYGLKSYPWNSSLTLVKRIFRWKTLLALTHHSSIALPVEKLLLKMIFRWKTLLELTHRSSIALPVDKLLLKMIF
uniref:SET domain-containing protein n=1 Tax=Magallana gigas TaxID=29159 RepID=A0A8W8INK9_MAGGI